MPVALAGLPDKKEHGLSIRPECFTRPLTTGSLPLNDVRNKETTVYFSTYNKPLTPVTGSITIGTVNQFPPSSF